MAQNYINPITKVFSTFAEAKKFYDDYGGIEIFSDREPQLTPAELARGNRNLIVGEPGVGKSLLLCKIQEHLNTSGYLTGLVNLRELDVEAQIDSFLKKKSAKPKALFLDALDEVQSSRFPATLQKIEKIASDNPDLSIYISSRWIFIKRYAKSFADFRFIVLCPFTQSQVKKYLLASGRSESDIDQLLRHIMSFSHRLMVIQIPRYLSYLQEYLDSHNIESAAKASRNDLFEHFIYSKLDYEDQKLQKDRKAILKRVLEKLALTMEIYQTNVITKDELMTFFDEVKSDLKLVALADIEILYERSILKDNIDSIEFDNSEFQEYLAAKEITRLPDPNRAAFSFSVDSEIKEFYSTWFNTLTFLVDMRSDLIGQLLDFSGIRAEDTFKVMDEGFLTFISRINPHSVPSDLRSGIFKEVVEYHTRTGQWMQGEITSSIPDFYEPALEEYLKSKIGEAEAKADAARYVPLGNIAYVVAYLLKAGVELDKPYWREKLLKYSADTNDNGVLQRHAVLALEYLGDPSVIDALTAYKSPDSLVAEGFFSLFKELDPDHPKSVEAFIYAQKENDIHGRYGILALRKRESLKTFLEAFVNDADFRREFLEDSRIFKDRDQEIVEHIAAVLDTEITDLIKKSLVVCTHHSVAHDADKSQFLFGLWKLLHDKNPRFVLEMIDLLKSTPEAKNNLYFALPFVASVIQADDVPSFIDQLLALGERWTAFSAMQNVKVLSGRPDADEVYEAGREKLPTEYAEWEARRSQPDAPDKDLEEQLLKEFRVLLEPEAGKFSYSVFDFYNDHKDKLDLLITEDERNRLKQLITGTIFKFIDPAKHELIITATGDGSHTYTTSGGIHTFGHALETARHLKIDITDFRQHIIDFIPFAYSDALSVIFELIKDVSPAEMAGVISVYQNHESDLWRHMPSSFVDAVERYHLSQAAPLLKQFVKEPAWEGYVRENSLKVGESLIPDPTFLKEIEKLYRGSVDKQEKKLADIANQLLIVNHGDRAAIQWRVAEIVRRAVAYKNKAGTGVHYIDDVEDEIHWSKNFAQPLMNLKHGGYEEDFLNLLDEAMNIWAKGSDFHEYAGYMWGIVYAYFDNLKEKRSYKPLQLLEKKIGEMKDRDGANWLASRMMHLRRAYLAYLGKPRSVSEAVRRYNQARDYDDKKIVSSEDLFHQLQGALETDLRRWIEGEGGYSQILGENVLSGKRKQYEKFIQRTLKTEVDNIMRRRGFEIDLLRESELLDGKKVDFWVKYGFVGPIVVEVKLTSNTDLKGDIAKKKSYASMSRYVEGFSATHGVLLVVDNTNAKNISEIKRIYQQIPKVAVLSFDCNRSTSAKRKARVVRKKKSAKKTGSQKSAKKTSRRRI